jgi:hypothetical protein
MKEAESVEQRFLPVTIDDHERSRGCLREANRRTGAYLSLYL